MSAHLTSARRPPVLAERPARRILATVVALFAVVATMFTAAPSASALTVRPRSAIESSIAWTVLAVMNIERAYSGLPALHMTYDLIVSARRHDARMAYYSTMSHQLPGEPYFGRRIQLAGYRWSYAGENIGWNSQMTRTGVVTLQKMMYNERAPYNGHRLNILSRQYRDVGVDVYLDWRHHKIWLTTDFGRH